VAVLGIVQLTRGKMSTAFTESPFEGSSSNPSSYALALFSGLWAYDGWDQGVISVVTPQFLLPTLPSANFIVGEMKNADKKSSPSHPLEHGHHDSTFEPSTRIVKALTVTPSFYFLLANVSYFLVLDKVSTNTISAYSMPETFSESPQWSVRIPSL
jgi:hypothetical protein